MINDFDISVIEEKVSTALRALGFPRVWNNRPKATDDTISDFVVVRVAGGVSDKAAFGTCRVLVTLFARDLKEVKNSKKLSLMQKKAEGLPLWIEPLLIKGTPRIVGDTPDDFGFHARTLNYKIYIKAD